MARKEVLFNEEDYTREYYLETLKMLKEDDVDCDWEEDNDTDFMDWESTQKGYDFDDLITNLNYSPIKNKMCVIVGSVGTWRGKLEIEPYFCKDIETAIYKCVEGYEIRSIIRKGNHIEVNVYHHDGSNSFNIFVLNDLGETRYRNNGEVSIHNSQNTFKIPKYIF